MHHPVRMAQQTCKHRRTARRAERVAAEAVDEKPALVGQFVDVRGDALLLAEFRQACAISADGLDGVVIGKDEDDVGLRSVGSMKRSEHQGGENK